MSKILYAASTYQHIAAFHLDYIAALRAEGHEVMTLANGEGADYNVPFVKKLLSPKNAECRRQIKQIVKDGGFDKVIVSTTLAAFHIRLALAAHKGVRIVNFVHGYLFSRTDGIVKRCVFNLCERVFRSVTDAVIVMNREDRQIAERHRLGKEVYFTHGMGVKERKPQKSREEVRAHLSASDSYVITFVGELSKRKNQAMLISAMPEIIKKIPNATLWLVGDGAELDKLKKLADSTSPDRVRFLGRREDVADIITASDLYVSCAKGEGLPFNVAEAMALRKTVVLSHIKGHEDLVQHAISGYLFDISSQNALVNAVLTAHEEPEKIKAQDIYEAYRPYSYDEVFSHTLSVIKEALAL